MWNYAGRWFIKLVRNERVLTYPVKWREFYIHLYVMEHNQCFNVHSNI